MEDKDQPGCYYIKIYIHNNDPHKCEKIYSSYEATLKKILRTRPRFKWDIMKKTSREEYLWCSGEGFK